MLGMARMIHPSRSSRAPRLTAWGRMRRIVTVVVVLLLGGSAARAQDARESWKVGVSGAAGFPAALGAVRFSAPLSPTTGIDLSVGRLAGPEGHQPGDGF